MNNFTIDDANVMDRIASMYLSKGVGSAIGGFMTGGIGVTEDDFWYYGNKMIRQSPDMFNMGPDGNLLILNVAKPSLKSFLDSGGFTGIATNNEEESAAHKRKKDLEYQKLEYEVKNVKRIYRTYWYTFAFALIGLLNVFLPLKEWISSAFRVIFNN